MIRILFLAEDIRIECEDTAENLAERETTPHHCLRLCSPISERYDIMYILENDMKSVLDTIFVND